MCEISLMNQCLWKRRSSWHPWIVRRITNWTLWVSSRAPSLCPRTTVHKDQGRGRVSNLAPRDSICCLDVRSFDLYDIVHAKRSSPHRSHLTSNISMTSSQGRSSMITINISSFTTIALFSSLVADSAVVPTGFYTQEKNICIILCL